MSEGLKKVRTNHRNIGGGSLQEEEDCKCKGPEAGMCIVYARNKEASVAAARCGRGGGGVDRIELSRRAVAFLRLTGEQTDKMIYFDCGVFF